MLLAFDSMRTIAAPLGANPLVTDLVLSFAFQAFRSGRSVNRTRLPSHYDCSMSFSSDRSARGPSMGADSTDAEPSESRPIRGQDGLGLGLLCAVGAHAMWGLFPLYWRLLDSVPSLELVCHRIVWAFVLLLGFVPLMLALGRLGGADRFVAAIRNPRVWGLSGLASVLIAANWLAFIWAVNHERVLEVSLGYYINPLLNILLGVIVLRERLRPAQWSAIAVAAIGVAVMTIAGGGLPWVSLAMAISFACYGLVKKKVTLPPLPGLLIETSFLTIPAAGYLWIVSADGSGSFRHHGLSTDLLLMTGGAVTVLPLALFATACRVVPLSTIGVLQYIGPTLQFFVGAVLFAEPLGRWRIVGFAFVWAGLLIYLNSSRRRIAEAKAEKIRQEAHRQQPSSTPPSTETGRLNADRAFCTIQADRDRG